MLLLSPIPLLLLLLLPTTTISALTPTGPSPIPLEIHIMSQCPDAASCWTDLISPSLHLISPTHYNFTLSFIGHPTRTSITCKHGASECYGNTLHLCASALSSGKLFERGGYGVFSTCLLERYEDLEDEKFVKGCVKENKVENEAEWGWEELKGCVEEKGEGLLRSSVERSREAGVGVSCTVRVEGKVWCVKDGEWKDCGGREGWGEEERVEALVRELEGRFHEAEPGMELK